jgi:DNA modification methylase
VRAAVATRREHFRDDLRLYTKRSDTVLDPFIGSGATAVAAANLGRKCVRYGISEGFCELTVANLAKRQPSLEAN